MAPIRCGGVPTSYSKQLLVVGDAAGHVDPLTGGCNVLLLFFIFEKCVLILSVSVYVVNDVQKLGGLLLC